MDADIDQQQANIEEAEGEYEQSVAEADEQYEEAVAETAAAAGTLGAALGAQIGSDAANTGDNTEGSWLDKAIAALYAIFAVLAALETGGGTGADISPDDLKWAQKNNLNAQSPTTKQILDNLDTPVSDFIGKFRQGSIKSEFPSEFLDVSVREAIEQGGSTVRKLLTERRFMK